MSQFFCSGCGPTRKCDVCGGCECSQDMQYGCPGCLSAKAQPYAWFLVDAARRGVRLSKPARKIRSQIERHRRLFRRHCPPVKFEDAIWD